MADTAHGDGGGLQLRFQPLLGHWVRRLHALLGCSFLVQSPVCRVEKLVLLCEVSHGREGVLLVPIKSCMGCMAPP